MTIQGTIQPSDYVAAQRLNLRPGIGLELPELLFILAGVCAAYVFTPWCLVLVLAYIAGWYFVYFPLMARRRYRQNQPHWTEMEMALHSNGLLLSPQPGGELMPWNEIHKWRSNRKVILIYVTAGTFLMVPRHFFPNAAAYRTLVEALSRHVGKQR